MFGGMQNCFYGRATATWDLEAIKVAIIYKIERGLALNPSERSIVDLNMHRAKSSNTRALPERMTDSVKDRAAFKFIADVRCVFSMSDFGFTLHLGVLLMGHGSVRES